MASNKKPVPGARIKPVSSAQTKALERTRDSMTGPILSTPTNGMGEKKWSVVELALGTDERLSHLISAIDRLSDKLEPALSGAANELAIGETSDPTDSQLQRTLRQINLSIENLEFRVNDLTNRVTL